MSLEPKQFTFTGPDGPTIERVHSKMNITTAERTTDNRTIYTSQVHTAITKTSEYKQLLQSITRVTYYGLNLTTV